MCETLLTGVTKTQNQNEIMYVVIISTNLATRRQFPSSVYRDSIA